MFLRRQSNGIEQMVSMYKTLLQKINVLNFAAQIFSVPVDQRIETSMIKALDNEVSASIQEPLLGGYETRIAYLGGTIPRED